MPLSPIGALSSDKPPVFAHDQLVDLSDLVRVPLHVVSDQLTGAVGVIRDGKVMQKGQSNGATMYPLLATLPPMFPEWLGDRTFAERHGVRFPYVAGAMANDIATTRMVEAMARAGMLGFFGAAGLSLSRVEAAVRELKASLGDSLPWGSNLIHSPNEPDLENSIADLYIREGVRRVSASAFMGLTPAVVRYAATGLHVDAQGNIARRNYLFAKISRPEVARHFMSPAPAALVDPLVRDGLITEQEARLIQRVPVAEDLTVEADSGGHTDNRPLTALYPIIANLRDELAQKHGYLAPIRLGAAGGIGTPQAVAGAFSLGAAYVVTGTVNQAAVESGLSESGRALLAEADMADVIMAPAADMFEMGVKVQVLRRGTMFGVRALKLYETYVKYDSIEAIPADERTKLERNVLGDDLESIWAGTRAFFMERDPSEVERAERDGKHRMALVFRWYLGLSSRWAIAGDASRRLDFQIWCGPAMGAFNAWTRGTAMAEPAKRGVVQIALNLLEGATVVARAQQLRSYGVAVPAAAFNFRPRLLTAP